MPDKNKYNFMGVSSIKQGEEQQQDGSNRPNIQNSGGRDGLQGVPTSGSTHSGGAKQINENNNEYGAPGSSPVKIHHHMGGGNSTSGGGSVNGAGVTLGSGGFGAKGGITNDMPDARADVSQGGSSMLA